MSHRTNEQNKKTFLRPSLYNFYCKFSLARHQKRRSGVRNFSVVVSVSPFIHGGAHGHNLGGRRGRCLDKQNEFCLKGTGTTP